VLIVQYGGTAKKGSTVQETTMFWIRIDCLAGKKRSGWLGFSGREAEAYLSVLFIYYSLVELAAMALAGSSSAGLVKSAGGVGNHPASSSGPESAIEAVEFHARGDRAFSVEIDQ